MVFALLVAAIIWNLGTWYFGLPASSSHTMVGSIIGVGIANQLMSATNRHQRRRLGAGVERRQVAAALADRRIRPRLRSCSADESRDQETKNSTKRPEGTEPPPFWIRCAAGPHLHWRQLRARLQRRAKGHGADHADPGRHRAHRLCAEPRRHAQAVRGFHGRLAASRDTLDKYVEPQRGRRRRPRRSHRLTSAPRSSRRTRCWRCASWSATSATKRCCSESWRRFRNDRVRNFRNDMYLVSEALRLMQKTKQPVFSTAGLGSARQLQEAHRQAHQVHPDLGEGRGGAGAGSGHHGRLEAHRGHGRRKDRQGSSHLRTGRRRRNHGDGHDRRRGLAWACRSAPRTCFRPAWPEPWPPTTPACNGPRCAISRWRGCSRCPPQ